MKTNRRKAQRTAARLQAETFAKLAAEQRAARLQAETEAERARVEAARKARADAEWAIMHPHCRHDDSARWAHRLSRHRGAAPAPAATSSTTKRAPEQPRQAVRIGAPFVWFIALACGWLP